MLKKKYQEMPDIAAISVGLDGLPAVCVSILSD